MSVNVLDQLVEQRWAMYNGDCVEVLKGIPDNSIHYSIFSPPFASLYTYSNSERDMGNCASHEEFHEQFKFLVRELYRVIMPGRLLSFHCMNLPTSKARNGYIGITDFRGALIKAFQEEGWIYHSEVCIWKNPVVAMQRTKALGLLHKQIRKDSAMCRQGIPDYLVTMRKPGENPERVEHTKESFPVMVWQHYASPVWMDIRESDTLQKKSAREHKDERHICPLQLEVIQRAIELWTNSNDIVLSPFAGIGSEIYTALRMGRRGIGIELKESYYNQAVENCKVAETEPRIPDLETFHETEEVPDNVGTVEAYVDWYTEHYGKKPSERLIQAFCEQNNIELPLPKTKKATKPEPCLICGEIHEGACKL